jgi:hypothetical protein
MSDGLGSTLSLVAFALMSDLHLFKYICFINAYWPKATAMMLKMQC